MAQHRYRNRRIFTVERATEEALERLVRAGLYRNASRAVDAAVALLLAQHERRGEVPAVRLEVGEHDEEASS